jgi:hypothetical protein
MIEAELAFAFLASFAVKFSFCGLFGHKKTPPTFSERR